MIRLRKKNQILAGLKEPFSSLFSLLQHNNETCVESIDPKTKEAQITVSTDNISNSEVRDMALYPEASEAGVWLVMITRRLKGSVDYGEKVYLKWEQVVELRNNLDKFIWERVKK